MTRISTTTTAVLAAAIAASAPAQDFTAGTFLQTGLSFFGSYYARDLNNNGQQDLIVEVISGPNAGFYVLLDPGTTSTIQTLTTQFLATQVGLFGGLPQLMGFADMNADGLDDLVVEFEDPFFGSEVLYLPGDGQGGFGNHVTLATVGNFTTTELADFNGDGEADFVYVDGSNVIIHLQNAGSFSQSLTINGGTFARAVVAGDFNGDGADDLALNFDGNMIVQMGGATWGPQVTLPVTASLNFGYSQDLDNDGFDDLVLQKSSTPPWLVEVFFGDPVATLQPSVDVIPGGGPNGSDFLGPFDIDGDGTDELLGDIRNVPGYFLIRHDAARGFSPEPYGTLMTGGLIDLDLDGDLDQLVPSGNGYSRLINQAIYGDACAGANGSPTLGIGSAIPGNDAFEVTVEQAAPNSVALLFVSAAGAAAPCGPQIDLGQLYFPGLIAPTDANGVATWPLPLPNNLPEGPYYMQAAILDAAGALTIDGLSLSATHGRTMRAY